MVQLADTVFSTGVDEKLAAVDVYSQSGNVSGSGVVDSATSSDDLATFVGWGDSTDAIDDIEEVALQEDSLKAVMLADDPDARSAFADLDEYYQKKLLSSSGYEDLEISDSDYPEMVVSRHKKTSSKNINALVKLVGSIGAKKGGLRAVSIAATAKFLSNVVNVSVKNGIPNVYAKIDSGGYGPKVMSTVTKNSLGLAVSTGNLNLMMNLANGSMAGSIKGMYPGFPAAFAASFKLDKNLKPQFFGQISSSITTSFGKIDVNWAKGKNGSTFNANLFLKASKDFKTVAKASVGGATRPYSRSSTTTASVSANLPGTAAFSLGVKGKQVSINGTAKMVYEWPSGKTQTYTKRADESYDVITTKPLPIFTPDVATPVGQASDYYDVDNSSINDPMALGGLVCKQAEDSSSNATANTSESIQSSFSGLDLDW